MLIMNAPQYINWNYTYKCNFNCTHCYSRAPYYPEELNSEDYDKVARQIIDAQVFRVALGGGEVLLRDDYLTVTRDLSAAGILTMITTNGWGITESVCNNLKKAELGRLYISLDSAKPETHDAIRQKVGSHRRVIDALFLSNMAGLTVYLSIVLSKLNAYELDDILDIAENNQLAGVNIKRFRISGNGFVNKDKYELSAAALSDIEKRIRRWKTKSKMDISLNFGPSPDGIDSGCWCGKTAITIRPNGDVSPCPYTDIVIGNMMTDSLLQLWSQSPILQDMRTKNGCKALNEHKYPSNPDLSKKSISMVR